MLEIEARGEDLRRAYARWVKVEELGLRRCRVSMDTDDFVWPLHILANVNAGFRVVEPVELREHVTALAERFTAAR